MCNSKLHTSISLPKWRFQRTYACASQCGLWAGYDVSKHWQFIIGTAAKINQNETYDQNHICSKIYIFGYLLVQLMV